MQVTLIGTGCEAGAQLTREADQALREAELIMGAESVLATLKAYPAEKAVGYRAEQILALLGQTEAQHVCAVFSGDTGFYSGAVQLFPVLSRSGIETVLMPGISSLQTFAARLGRTWSDWKLCSAHGRPCDIRAAVMCGQPCFFLTGGKSSPSDICRELAAAGLGELTVYVGENLSSLQERVSTGTAAEMANRSFSPLSVILTEAAPVFPRRMPGIPDDEFLRDKVPMTKQIVRAAVLSALHPTPEEVCWDIGAGTGSVSVELALNSRGVWAVERKPEAVTLIKKNREKFCAWNLRVVEAEAPDGLETLPAPDAVFVGGTGGNLKEILTAVRNANRYARVCVSAIALETPAEACRVLNEMGYCTEVIQLSVSRTHPAGELHLLMAQNPVFLITGDPAANEERA